MLCATLGGALAGSAAPFLNGRLPAARACDTAPRAKPCRLRLVCNDRLESYDTHSACIASDGAQRTRFRKSMWPPATAHVRPHALSTRHTAALFRLQRISLPAAAPSVLRRAALRYAALRCAAPHVLRRAALREPLADRPARWLAGAT